MTEQGAFTTTASSHDDEGFTLVDFEADAVENGAVAEFTDQVGDLNDRLAMLRRTGDVVRLRAHIRKRKRCR